MRATVVAAAMVSAIGLWGCGTVPMVNGVALDVHAAQGGAGTFCGRNSLLCLTGGALLAGGVALAASSGHGGGSGDPPAAANSGSGSSHRTLTQIP